VDYSVVYVKMHDATKCLECLSILEVKVFLNHIQLARSWVTEIQKFFLSHSLIFNIVWILTHLKVLNEF